jgi:hypothetical protein
MFFITKSFEASDLWNLKIGVFCVVLFIEGNFYLVIPSRRVIGLMVIVLVLILYFLVRTKLQKL